jgi:hypothetical protein
MPLVMTEREMYGGKSSVVRVVSDIEPYGEDAISLC